MPTDAPKPPGKDTGGNRDGGKQPLTAAAQRACAEAAARRAKRARDAATPAKESGGRGGLDPTRYGDWEIKGLASDF